MLCQVFYYDAMLGLIFLIYYYDCSDAFARLYDRRMLPPLSSSMKKLSAPPCVNYFCPMHLSDRVSNTSLQFLSLCVLCGHCYL